MSKKCILVLFVTLALLATGCKSDRTVTSDLVSDKPHNIRSEIYEENLGCTTIKISYPQIKNDGNALTEKINTLIKESAVARYENIKGLTLDQSFTIEKRDRDTLSITFYRYSYISGTAHPTNSCYAITINLNDAKRKALSDIIDSYETIEKSITEKKYEVLYGGFRSCTSDEIVNTLKDHFFNYAIDISEDNFYISEDNRICIIVDLPKGGGDYSIIKTNLIPQANYDSAAAWQSTAKRPNS